MGLQHSQPSRLQQTAAVQIEQLTRRASYNSRVGDIGNARRHELQAVAWKALMGRYAAPSARRAGW